MKISSDRALYLSRILLQKLKAEAALVPSVDEETLRRALTRAVTDAAGELEKIEEQVREKLAARKGANARDFDILFARDLEAELRKHGA